MKNLRSILLTLAFALGLAACGGDPVKPVFEALKSGDLAKCEALSDALVEAKPDLKPLRALRFVLFHHLSIHGPSDKQQAYLHKSIAEYDALVQSLGLKPDYEHMEESLRSIPEGAKLLKTARGPLYGD